MIARVSAVMDILERCNKKAYSARKPMRSVLMISQKFPPFSGVDVMRVSKFVRYLPEFGWRPIVFTCKISEDELDKEL